MIHIERLHRGDIYIVKLDGPLRKEDFEQLAQELDPIIASRGKLTGLMIYAKSFPGWQSLGAFVEHFEFDCSYHRSIERIAAVTNNKLLKVIGTSPVSSLHRKLKLSTRCKRSLRSPGL